MPDLKAKVAFEEELIGEAKVTGRIDWMLKIAYKRKGRNDVDLYPVSGNKTLDISQTWDVNFNNEFRGGKGILSWQYKDFSITEFTFYIRGKNPEDSDVESYIDDNASSKLWYAKAVARHESGGSYMQFNEVGDLGPNWSDYKNCPNWGTPNGWGMMQLDTPDPDPQTLWSWQANVAEGISRLESKRQAADNYFEAIERTYPNEYEEPLSYTISDTTLTALEAAAIQLYNGAGVRRRLYEEGKNANEFGDINDLSPEQKSNVTRLCLSCWEFNPNADSGNKWSFDANSQNYVEKLVSEYESKN